MIDNDTELEDEDDEWSSCLEDDYDGWEYDEDLEEWEEW